jgi:hypothetical protein
MPRFFMHTTNRVGLAADEEGVELESLAAAVEQAKEGVRSIVSDEARAGCIDLNGRVEISNETGDILAVVPFPVAFDIVMPADRAYPEE